MAAAHDAALREELLDLLDLFRILGHTTTRISFTWPASLGTRHSTLGPHCGERKQCMHGGWRERTASGALDAPSCAASLAWRDDVAFCNCVLCHASTASACGMMGQTRLGPV